ncbi:MAG: ATP-binding cassette domain-containing protein, partial [Myxococcota bacterium]|nr:ATP-binding cassette domain-containing protein [Myxococcota bacterium]
GVSGSGKSTLIEDELYPGVCHALGIATRRRGRRPTHRQKERTPSHVEGAQAVDKVIVIDQTPIGRTPRSNPATYTGALDPIRTLFAALPASRARGYRKGRFSFNVIGGRCEECQGAGIRTIEMQFMGDVQVPCESCGGRRFNTETLEIRYRGKSITDVLEMTVAEATAFFMHHRKIHRILSTLERVGLDYVSLGQPSTTLSGGEAQRVKLATELQRPSSGRTLYLLDEPTTGLHMADIERLLHALDALVESGNTVIVIEHNSDVLKCADHIVDLGPEGGEAGGTITGEGTPEHIATLGTPTGEVVSAALTTTSVLPADPVSDPGTPAAWGDFQAGLRAHKKSRRGKRYLEVCGAYTHNLKGIDVRIPHAQLTVVTGLSGSGKTSLAFHTIFQEGQRRYVEALSTYARRFLGRAGRAPVDRVQGLAPAIAIEQRNRGHNPRSTVATVTEIQDGLRLLFARIGQPHCPQCQRPLYAQSPSQAARHLRDHAKGAGWILATLE